MDLYVMLMGKEAMVLYLVYISTNYTYYSMVDRVSLILARERSED